MITDPRFAPQRSDLGFLRRRSRPRQETPPASTPVATVAGTTDATAGGTKVDYHRHATPATPATPATRSAPASPPPPPITSTPASSSLDLSDPAPQVQSTPRRRTPAAAAQSDAWQQRHVVRVHGREQRIMAIADPTVTLTRVQSGVGELTIEAVCSPEVGDLRLGAVYQLRSGGSGVVAHADGSRFGPSARRPVLVGSREEYERVGVDLRQVGEIARLALFAYSESRAELAWGGTLVTTLDGGARLELPLERLPAARIAVLTTLYNMDGELVVRAELEAVSGDIREAARAYGFDRITWRDERHPTD